MRLVGYVLAVAVATTSALSIGAMPALAAVRPACSGLQLQTMVG